MAPARELPTLHAVVNTAPRAPQDYADALPASASFVYDPGYHLSIPDKSHPSSVEADHAELRQYLARWGRRSRCFSRS